MGVVRRPGDVIDKRRRIEVAVRDLSPGVRELVLSIVNSWSGKKSFEELKKAIGEERANRIVKELNLSGE
ncbi:MAG: hypothetical protein ACUVUS_08500 [Thermoproteota archaeon]